MHIAQIAPLHEAVPPRLYGGTERIVHFLTEALIDLGHDVTLFASGDSATRATLVPMVPRALRLDPSVRDTVAPHLLMIEYVRRRASEFDVMHGHLDYWPFSLMARQPVPLITTLHGRLDLPELGPVFAAFPTMPVVSISDSQRAPLPQARFVATIHHGIPKNLLRPQTVTPSYLAFLGRIAPEKCPDQAIRIARAVGLPLKLAAKVDRADQDYFDSKIKPLLGSDAELIGEIGEHEKAAFLCGAHALLMPIDWPEPFGLVMIEAMACGTPVIAFRRGAVPEIVEDGISGYSVESEAEAIDAVGPAMALSRSGVRACFEQRFTADRMARDYVAFYTSLQETDASALGLTAGAG